MYYIIASVLKICGMICGNRIINGYVSILVNPSQDVNNYIKDISKTLKTLEIKEFENILEFFILYNICFISLIFVVKIVAF